MRVLRAFRLLRLLGSWGQLRRIVLAIVKSILPVIYSMVLKPNPTMILKPNPSTQREFAAPS